MFPLHVQLTNSTLRRVNMRLHFPLEIMLVCDDSGAAIELRQSKYLNNLVEQDHRAIKRRTRPMDGLQVVQVGRPDHRRHRDHAHGQERQLGCLGGLAISPADYFYSLAAA